MKADEWVAVEFIRESDLAAFNSMPVIVRQQRSPFYSGIRWSVRTGSMCLNTSSEWEYEPMPSSRDDAFYERCRFPSFEAAVTAWQRVK